MFKFFEEVSSLVHKYRESCIDEYEQIYGEQHPSRVARTTPVETPSEAFTAPLIRFDNEVCVVEEEVSHNLAEPALIVKCDEITPHIVVNEEDLSITTMGKLEPRKPKSESKPAPKPVKPAPKPTPKPRRKEPKYTKLPRDLTTVDDGFQYGFTGSSKLRLIQRRCQQFELVNESQFLVGGVQGLYTARFKLSDFLDSSVYNRFDMFKITHIDYYATFRPTNISGSPTYQNFGVHVFSSFDPDSTTAAADWDTFQNRSNIREHYLTYTQPRHLVQSFKPVPNFNNTAGDNPSNIIPDPNSWIDCAAANTQYYNGIVFAFQSPDYNSSASIPIACDGYAVATIELKYSV